MSKMKILILGAGGMVGHVVSMYFIEKRHEVITCSTKPINYGRNIVGDALDLQYLNYIAHYEEYDAVINCIGILNKNCETNQSSAIFLNSFLPQYFKEILAIKDAKLVQISTDCVFSGKTGLYIESSIPDGETIYDRTKALGEIIDNKNLTLRTSLIGPDHNLNGMGLLNWFMKQERSINGFSRVIWTGVSTITLARAIEKAIEEELCGIYHLVNNEYISKYDLLCLFNKHLKRNSLEVVPSQNVEIDKSLVCTRSDFPFTVPSYEYMVEEIRDWVDTHKCLYPHYKINTTNISNR